MVHYVVILKVWKGLGKGTPSLLTSLSLLWKSYLLCSLKVSLPKLTFHWRAKLCNLTHLCFADDLILFCHGDINSIFILHQCIIKYSLLSGLMPNPAKSQCFLAGIPISEHQPIFSLLGFPLCSLLVKFLGVPHISIKLTSADCVPLVDKITARVTSWANIFLSYAGRIQLINSVLFAMQSF